MVACTVSANVGDLDRAVGDGGTEASPESDAAGAEGSDAAADAKEPIAHSADVVDGGCGVVLPQHGKLVDIALVNGPPPSHSSEGTLTPGVYELTAVRVYFSGKSGTMSVRETMRVRGSSAAGTFERLMEAKNASGTFEAYPQHGERATFEVQGPALFVTPECPKDDFERISHFSSVGDTLSVFDNSTSEERVYRRVE